MSLHTICKDPRMGDDGTFYCMAPQDDGSYTEISIFLNDKVGINEGGGISSGDGYEGFADEAQFVRWENDSDGWTLWVLAPDDVGSMAETNFYINDFVEYRDGQLVYTGFD